MQGYRGKREVKGAYLAVNAYLGASGGAEWVDGDKEAFVGVSAPVGLEVGGAIGKGWSLGMFAQLIDLGALASYRLGDSQLETEPEIGFAQVFSPGGYLVFGFPKFPLAVGVGANLAPSLRKVSTNNDDTRNASRLTLFWSIDMPLFRVK